MSDVVYISKSVIERRQGPLRVAHLPGESHPIIFSVHGAIAKHYKVDPASLHKTLLDFICVCGNAEREGRRIGNG